jgi:hypothetical protein
MADLAALGITTKRRFLSGSGAEVDQTKAELTEIGFTLPKSTEVQATFAFEGFTERLVKIFKKELQTGDGLFDEHVHIKTDTPRTTAKLLESSELRAIIEGIVGDGGAVEIDGAVIKLEIKGNDGLDAERTKHLVEALMR